MGKSQPRARPLTVHLSHKNGTAQLPAGRAMRRRRCRAAGVFAHLDFCLATTAVTHKQDLHARSAPLPLNASTRRRLSPSQCKGSRHWELNCKILVRNDTGLWHRHPGAAPHEQGPGRPTPALPVVPALAPGRAIRITIPCQGRARRRGRRWAAWAKVSEGTCPEDDDHEQDRERARVPSRRAGRPPSRGVPRAARAARAACRKMTQV